MCADNELKEELDFTEKSDQISDQIMHKQEAMPELFILGNPSQGETAYLDPPGSGKEERIMRIAASLADHH